MKYSRLYIMLSSFNEMKRRKKAKKQKRECERVSYYIVCYNVKTKKKIRKKKKFNTVCA